MNILYLTPDSMVKLYANEEHRGEVLRAVEEAEVVTSSLLCYPEVRAALARKEREGKWTGAQHDRATADFEADLSGYVLYDVTPEIAAHAAELARPHHLKAYDAVHLATALAARGALEEAYPRTHGEVPGLMFLTYDGTLGEAARGLGLATGSMPTRDADGGSERGT